MAATVAGRRGLIAILAHVNVLAALGRLDESRPQSADVGKTERREAQRRLRYSVPELNYSPVIEARNALHEQRARDAASKRPEVQREFDRLIAEYAYETDRLISAAEGGQFDAVAFDRIFHFYLSQLATRLVEAMIDSVSAHRSSSVDVAEARTSLVETLRQGFLLLPFDEQVGLLKEMSEVVAAGSSVPYGLGDAHPLIRRLADREPDPAASEILMRGITTYREQVEQEESGRK
jgi:hypothetical protein